MYAGSQFEILLLALNPVFVAEFAGCGSLFGVMTFHPLDPFCASNSRSLLITRQDRVNASGIAGHSTYFNGCPIYKMGRLESISGLTISFSSGKFIQAGGLHTGLYTLLVLKFLGILKTWLCKSWLCLQSLCAWQQGK